MKLEKPSVESTLVAMKLGFNYLKAKKIRLGSRRHTAIHWEMIILIFAVSRLQCLRWNFSFEIIRIHEDKQMKCFGVVLLSRICQINKIILTTKSIKI